MSGPKKRFRMGMTGKIGDPVFLCMVGAVLLAIASSVALRAVVAKAGTAARDEEEQPFGIDVGPHQQLMPEHNAVEAATTGKADGTLK